MSLETHPLTTCCNPTGTIDWDIEGLRERCLGSEPMLAKIVDRFRSTLEQEPPKISAAWKAGDWHQLMRLVHRLKGTAATFGAHRLEHVCTELEMAIHGSTSAGVSQQLAELAAYLPTLHDAIEHTMSLRSGT